MSSKNYDRAQAMVLLDKYGLTRDRFHEELASLAKRYFDVECISVDAYYDNALQISVNLSVKKVKNVKRA